VKTDWRNRAACLSHEPELFFPIGTTGPARAHLADAQKVCQSCEVQTDCLQWALSNGVDYGVWGGYSEDQRRSLRRRAARSRNTSVGPR
jgi:WhiB family transcriptional regulator, redox-sensing transcriptional regulator